jgi:3-hydroxyethyl bacteriochlorophyllide a dehydrogenase
VVELNAHAVIFDRPGHADFRAVDLTPPGPGDIVVQVDFSGISTGTERLLWTGTMPEFPGMGYPLVPGYESTGQVVWAGPESNRKEGQRVFVPGAACFCAIRGLFGGAASMLVVPGKRTQVIDAALGERGILLALAATAHSILRAPEGGFRLPGLIIGHGALGRLLARLTVLLGDQPPVVWENDPKRSDGGSGYRVTRAVEDDAADHAVIVDVSGSNGLLDSLIARLAPGGEIVLGGFYSEPLQFAFPPAFMRRARLRVAAEWAPEDLEAVSRLACSGELDLGDLITDRSNADLTQSAYEKAFDSAECLKMVLDWRTLH